MSAIAGILNFDGSPADLSVIRSMAAPVSHRGPDGAGYYAEGPVALAELRSVTTSDAYGTASPAVSARSGAVLVWDGRLDNRAEIVGAVGDPAISNARTQDNELVLAAYEKWGASFLTRIVGDFALALWDQQSRTLICARDPVGIRLLHYYADGSRLVFATEIKQLLAHPAVPRRLNPTTLGMYLCGTPIFGELTFYEGISRLKGGYRLVARDGRVRPEVFWDPGRQGPVSYPAESDYIDRFRELFLDAVRVRMRGTSSVGIFLSGGLDSGSIASSAGYIRQRNPDGMSPVCALHWTVRNPEVDEWPYAAAVASKYGIPVERLPADDLWAMKRQPGSLTWDEPLSTTFEALNCEGLRVFGSSGVRIALTGEGGDEAFAAGYMLYLRDWLLGFRWGRLAGDLRRGTPNYRRDALKMLRRSLTPHWLRRSTGRRLTSAPHWVRSDFARKAGVLDRMDAHMASHYRDRGYIQARGTGPFFLSADQRAAFYGVEMRHPFYDSRVVEFLARIPPSVRVQGGREKRMLKLAMRGIAPDRLLSRNHYGAFARQLHDGFKVKEVARLRDLSERSTLEQLGMVNSRALRDSYEAYLAGDESRFARLFWSFAAEEWLRDRWPELRPSRTSGSPAPSAAHVAGTAASA
jgi:asparagine synthase (glutamine-hydrolysing)